jgi:hypothetical protein
MRIVLLVIVVEVAGGVMILGPNFAMAPNGPLNAIRLSGLFRLFLKSQIRLPRLPVWLVLLRRLIQRRFLG